MNQVKSDQERASQFVNGIVNNVIARCQSLTKSQHERFLSPSDNTNSFNKIRQKIIDSTSQIKRFQSFQDGSRLQKQIFLNSQNIDISGYQSQPPHHDDAHTLKEIDKSSSVCKFCKQAVNTSLLEDSQPQKKQKNLGFFNYSFIYSLTGTHKQHDKENCSNINIRQSDKKLQSFKKSQNFTELIDIQGSNPQKKTMKQSSGNFGSFDFELSQSQLQQKDSQVESGKGGFMNMMKPTSESQYVSQIFQQKQSIQNENFEGVSDLINFKTISTEVLRSQQNLQLKRTFEELQNIQIQNLEELNKQQQQKSNCQQNDENNQLPIRYQNQKKAEVLKESTKYKNISNFLAPTDDKIILKDHNQRINSKSFNQKDLLADPMELLETEGQKKTSEDQKQQTPLTKILDMIDISDIDAHSEMTSPSMTLQQNLFKEFERENQPFRHSPKSLRNKITDQIASQKQKVMSNQTTTQKVKNGTNCRPCNSSQKAQNFITAKPQSVYQKVLCNKKK